jgi:hypothetical protein
MCPKAAILDTTMTRLITILGSSSPCLMRDSECDDRCVRSFGAVAPVLDLRPALVFTPSALAF